MNRDDWDKLREIATKLKNQEFDGPSYVPDLLHAIVDLEFRVTAMEGGDNVESFLSWKRLRIATSPEVLGGEAVFKGTRLSVRHIGGMEESQGAILADYPYLSKEDVRMARLYARRTA